MIRTPLDDPELTAHLETLAADGMDIFLLNDANYRGAMLHGTRMVNQMRANHELGILESLMLGHSYIAAGLLTSLVKGNDRVLLGVECSGPVRGISVESSARGEVRGYLKHTPIPVDGEVTSFNLAPYIGTGTLTVTRQLEKARHPFTGRVDIVYGNLAKDLAHYFVTSEQLPTAVSLSIQFDRQGRVTGAGGLFLQSMPGSEPSAAAELEEAVRGMPSIGSLFAAGETPAHVVNAWLRDFRPEAIGSRSVEFSCSCNRQRYSDYLRSLPDAELADIRENGPFPLRVTCHNCNSTYQYTREELDRIAAGSRQADARAES